MSSRAPQKFEWAKNIPCRNIQIHGYCKYENKGCSFNHDLARKQRKDGPADSNPPLRKPAAKSTNASPSNSASSSFNVNTPSFTPSKFLSNPGTLKGVAAFVPSRKEENKETPEARKVGACLHARRKQRQPTGRRCDERSRNTTHAREDCPNAGYEARPWLHTTDADECPASADGVPIGHGQPVMGPPPPGYGEDQFFRQTNPFPMNYHLYAPEPPPHVEMNKQPNERSISDLFIPNQLREYIQQKNEASLRSIANGQLNLPLHIGPYHSLYPIDKHFDKTDKAFGYPACPTLMAGCIACDGEDVPITSGRFLEPIKQWSLVDNSNVVKVYDAFTTKAFGDMSLIVIYDYHPLSLNLMETHFFRIGNRDPELITESVLWSYLVQLVNATTAIHQKDLFVGDYDPTKVIVTNKGRIKLSACGINDIVEASKAHNQFQNGNNLKADGTKMDTSELTQSKEEKAAHVSAEQKRDLVRLGELILNLAKSTVFIKETEAQSMTREEVISRLQFSSRFKAVLNSWEELQASISPEILKIADGFQKSCDYMEANLTREVENARLVRLFAKLNVISERPEFLKDGSWSETGKRYPVKLFKDFVFHQVDETGHPVVDLTHIINCLNKLDAGVDENLLLVSPDEMTCLVTSYKQLKELVDNSFREVRGE
ncbi:hypothetical protein HII12_003970 [Brettanomyces bruxellensis]|uniref:PAN2-PAN3 deadenylation complex subunit PAN3 n=1 Tax=Dekkera bruxellensis TaxID=5007 RepID=A0A8H6BC57_DEKBR|nr:hypothetical protein HII12_003970 [Brettanomyces bruxellensis]